MKKWFQLYRTWLLGTITAVVLLAIGGLVGELKEIYSAIVGPYLYIGTLLTQFEAADNWTKLLFAFLCLLFYVSVISFIPLLIAKDWSRAEKAPPAPEIMLYTEEISAAMEVIERPEVTEMEIMDTVEHLMRTIGTQAMSIFPGLDYRFVRASFLVTDSDGNIMAVRLGRHFAVTTLDMEMVDWILRNTSKNPYLEGNVRDEYPKNDMEAIGFIRNQGPYFRFGYVIMLPKKEMITAETDAHFKAAAAAVQHIVYMDKLWKLMVSYSQNLGGGGRDGSSRSGA